VSFWLEGNGLSGIVPLPVAQLGAKVSWCVFVPPGNEGLYMPDTQPYRDADLDGDGKICGLGLTATPETVAAELRSAVAGLCDAGALNKGLCNALTVKIDQALKLLAKGKPGEAIEVVQGFIDQVEGITPSHLTPEQATPLIERARILIALIEMGMG